MDTTTVIERGVGDNNPPSNAEILQEHLGEAHADLISRRDELLAAFERAPAAVDDDETCGKVSDFVKQIMAAHKTAEAQRVSEKEPHLEAGRIVDGFFKKITEPLAKIKKDLEARVTVFQRKKAEEERQRREAEERAAREEAARLAKEAAEREAALKDDADLNAAIAADEAARKAKEAADAAAKAADAKAAELSRNRGDLGSVASLRTTWTFADLDRETIDLEALRQHIPTDGLEKAVRAYIKAGGRELKGVRIFAEENAVIR